MRSLVLLHPKGIPANWDVKVIIVAMMRKNYLRPCCVKDPFVEPSNISSLGESPGIPVLPGIDVVVGIAVGEYETIVLFDLLHFVVILVLISIDLIRRIGVRVAKVIG